MPRLRAVVTDLDNTLYPWVDYIVPSPEAMVDSLVATTGLPRVRIVQSLKEVYTRYESNEYPFAIQESDIFQPYERDIDSFNRMVVDPARRAFKQARERYLRPYPGVVETLDWIRERGLTLVALSDAPRNAAELRLKWLGLDGHFDALYTLPGGRIEGPREAPVRFSKSFRSRVLTIALAIALPAFAAELPRARPETVGLSSARLERIGSVMQGYVDEGRLGGAVTLVARNGKVAYFQAFGKIDPSTGAPMPADAVFRIASQTKAVTSVAVMILFEEGRLLLGDPVSKYFPEFQETTVAVPDTAMKGRATRSSRPSSGSPSGTS